MSPDWSAKEDPVPYAKLDNPQSLNLYGYVLNNPLGTADADGHEGCCTLADLEELVNKGTEEGRQMIAAAAPVVVAGAETLGEITVSAALAPVVAIGGLIASPQAAGNWNDDHPNAQTRDGRPPSADNPVITSSYQYGQKSIPAGPSPTPTAAQQKDIDAMGDAHGCHECGATTPGTKSGHWVGDHNPATSQNPSGGPQTYKPHCLQCSRRQGGRIRAAQAKAAAAAKKEAKQQQ
jgi:hypothetical protein